MAAGLIEAGGREGMMAMVPGKEDLKRLADIYQALSDPVRLLILNLLSVSDLCPCVLKDLTGLTDSKLSYHLGILERAGLVVWRQSRNWRVYRITELATPFVKRGPSE